MSSRKQLANLKPWPKGVSGNHKGRPRKTAPTDALRELLASGVPGDPEGRTYADAIAEALVKRAMRGDVQAAREIADRAEGKPLQAVALGGEVGAGLAERIAAARKRVSGQA